MKQNDQQDRNGSQAIQWVQVHCFVAQKDFFHFDGLAVGDYHSIDILTNEAMPNSKISMKIFELQGNDKS